VDERPGTWLEGEPFVGSVSDWTFTAGIDEIFIETRPWYGLPHSTTIWCVELEGRLYIGSYGDVEKAWEKAIAHDSAARLRIDGRLHEVTLVPVDDPRLNRKVDSRYGEKYDMGEVFGEDVPAWRYYRVEQSEPYAAKSRDAGRPGEAPDTAEPNTVEFDDMAPEIEFGPYRRGDSLSGAFSTENAARFLDRVATDWGKKYQCVTCHTNGFYLTAPPEIFRGRPAFREARQQALAFVEAWEGEFHPRSILAVLGYEEVPETYVVATGAFLAIHEASLGGGLSAGTRRALDLAWELQAEGGSWPDWIVCNWPPFESDEHFGVTLMAIAAGMAPESYRGTEGAREGMARIRRYLAEHPPAHLHQKGMLLWAAAYNEGLVDEEERARWIAEFLALQRSDGAWASGDLGVWRQREGRPDDPLVNVESDGYGTGFAIFVLRQAGVPGSNPQIRSGIAWLKTHQREDGYWWTQSLRNEEETQNFLTHTGTTFALKALAAAGP
jgi:squalene-hopene/tetraprenyl-beta-curcumene cyclase